MICQNCGTQNEDTYQFCIKCGTPLASSVATKTEQPDPIEEVKPLTQTSSLHADGRRHKDLLKDKITPAEGEVSVRTYYCTYYISRLLGLEAWGYLGVTNKRVIFQALGTSNAGSSVIQSELPIADVSGISSYKGTFFSFGHVAVAFIASTITFGVFSSIIAVIGTVMQLASAYVSETNSTTGGTLGLQVIAWIIAVGSFLLSLSRARHSIWRTVLASMSGAGFSAAAGGGLLGGLASSFAGENFLAYAAGGLATLALFLGFVASIYALFCVFWYARRPTFSLAISSKGGSDTPISISGASGLGLFSVSAGRALTAEPATDAEQMLQELGAVILDVQMLGDMGIAKWKVL